MIDNGIIPPALMKLASRLPSWHELLPVLSLVVFIVYSWTIFRMLYQIPSWLLSHSKHGLFNLAVYVFSFALLESLVMTGFVLLLCLLLPGPILRERFIPQGTVAVIACTAWALVAQFFREEIGNSSLAEIAVYISIFILSLLLLMILTKRLLIKFGRVGDQITSFTERTTVFAWIYIPLGLFSTIIVIARNIL
jgi:hypothetical protein